MFFCEYVDYLSPNNYPDITLTLSLTLTLTLAKRKKLARGKNWKRIEEIFTFLLFWSGDVPLKFILMIVSTDKERKEYNVGRT